MSPLDVRTADPGLGPGSTKSFSSSRQGSAADFDDAFNAAGEQTAATKKDGGAETRSSGKEFSWDPRMKDAGAPAGDRNDTADDVRGQLPKTEASSVSVPQDCSDDEIAASENRTEDEDKKEEEIATAVAVPPAGGPNVTPSTTTKGGDSTAGAQAGSALPPAKTDLLPRQPESKAEKSGEAVSEDRQPLVVRGGEDRPKGRTSALTALGSRLAELAGEGTGAPKADAPSADTSKTQTAANGDAAEHVSTPQDSHAGAAKTNPADGLAAALRLPGTAPAGGRNVSAVTAGIASSPAWMQVLASADVTTARGVGPVNALRIQLHPADLGVVTATLRLSGGHLVINLKVETAAAYRQLSADNHAIVDKLKGHGYVVESIAVQHVAADRPGAPQPQQTAGFANQHAGGQAAAGGGGQPFDQNSGSRGGNSHFWDEQAASIREPANPADASGRAVGGIYI